MMKKIKFSNWLKNKSNILDHEMENTISGPVLGKV
jgi:hypothetical protein